MIPRQTMKKFMTGLINNLPNTTLAGCVRDALH
jgi:hypothetical protein